MDDGNELPEITITSKPLSRFQPGDLRVTHFYRVTTHDGALVGEFKWDDKIPNDWLGGHEGTINHRLNMYYDALIGKMWRDMAGKYAQQRARENAIATTVNPAFPAELRGEKPVDPDWNRPICNGAYVPEAFVTRLLDVHSEVPWAPYKVNFRQPGARSVRWVDLPRPARVRTG